MYPKAGCGQATSTTSAIHLPLHKWFLAIYLFATDKRGCSALSLAQELEIRYHAAWLTHNFIFRRAYEKSFRIYDMMKKFFS